MAETTVGVDIGTTSVKAVAADGDGRVVARAQVHHGLGIPSPGRLQHDPDQAWRHGVRTALDELGPLTDLGVRAVNVAAMVPSLAAFDEAGAALSPGLLYGDERGAHHKSPANDEGELLGFLEWLVGEVPDAAAFWPAQAAANHLLGGEAVIDTTCAATATPVWFGTGWNSDVLDPLGLTADRLPKAVELGGAAGRLTDAPDVVLGAGAVDALCEQVVSGADEPGDVLVILGTTLITWLVTEGWPEAPGLWTIPSMTDAGRALVGGPSNAGGLFTDWVRRLLASPTEPPTEPPAATDPAAVPVWLPWPRGERVPHHDRALRASLHDLDLTHGPGEVQRATFEATAFMARVLVERAAAASGTEPRRLLVAGGGSAVQPWVQALSDAFALPATVTGSMGGALGSAWFARMAAGLETELAAASRWARPAGVVQPADAWVGPTGERYGRFVSAAGLAGGAGQPDTRVRS